MSRKLYSPTGIIGGTSTSDDIYDLDSLAVSALNDGDLALVSYAGSVFYYRFDSTATDAESYPTCIRPDDFVSAGVWELQSINQAGNILSSGVTLTGGILGLNYSKTSDNVITVESGNCMDATNAEWLSAAASQTVDIDTTGSEIYHLFLCSDGVVRTDTDVTGATTLSAYTKRWIGFVKNNTSGDIADFLQKGDLFQFIRPSEALLSSIPTSYTQLDLSDVLPESRIIGIEYGVIKVSTDSRIIASEDGTFTSFSVGHATTTADTGDNTWGNGEYQKSSMKVYNPDRYFKALTANTKIAAHTLLMAR